MASGITSATLILRARGALARAATLALVATGLCACASSRAGEDRPAVVKNPTQESRTELLHAVSSALGVERIVLADDALTKTSELAVDRLARRDAMGRLLNGREIGSKAQHFQLVRSGHHCVLIHAETGTRTTLKATHCETAPHSAAADPVGAV